MWVCIDGCMRACDCCILRIPSETHVSADHTCMHAHIRTYMYKYMHTYILSININIYIYIYGNDNVPHGHAKHGLQLPALLGIELLKGGYRGTQFRGLRFIVYGLGESGAEAF